MIRALVALIALTACEPGARGEPSGIAGEFPAKVAAVIDPARAVSVHAPDVDARGELQALIDVCAAAPLCPGVHLAPGVYTIVTPPAPRAVALLDVRVSLFGSPAGTVIRCVGDTAGLDWRCMQVRGGVAVRRLRIETSLVGVAEQSHVIRVDGPAAGVVLADLEIDHPTPGGGDAIQVVGYSPDRLITGLEVARVSVPRSSRSGIAIHSGLHSARLHHLVFGSISDQSIDGEGSGDTEDVAIDHVVDHRLGQTTTSIQVMGWTRLRLADVQLAGGVDLYGCTDCEISDAVIRQAAPTTNAVLTIRKTSPRVTVRSSTIERAASAGPGMVVAIAQRIGAPRDVALVDVQLIQHAPSVALQVVGVDGLSLERLAISYDGAPLALTRTDAIQLTGGPTVRTDRVSIVDSSIGGAYRAAILVAGQVGAVDVAGTWAPLGVRCEAAIGPVVVDGEPACP